ncbi:MAG: PQQ-like beta-propeller repeat protein [Deltaproteobacteria bacterium]|nr:PQQ-like beta-propeller repeat protein [Deltaproteobacteria bacterium]
MKQSILFFLIFLLLSCSAKKDKSQISVTPQDTSVSKDKIRGTDNLKISKNTTDSKSGWTMFRGGRGRTGSSTVKGPRTASLKWTFRTLGRIYADAVISKDGETIYVGSHDYFLYAIDKNGLKKWSYNTGGQIWSSPAVGRDGNVYVGSDSDSLTALTPDGKVAWKFITTLDPPKGEPKYESGRFDVDTSPLILNDGTIVFGCSVNLFAIKPQSGQLKWSFQSGKGRTKIFSSPAASPDGTIFFGNQGNYFFAINEKSDVIWSKKTGGDNDSTPVVDSDGNMFFASDDGVVRGVSTNYKELFELDVKAAVRAPLGLSADGTLYASTYGREPSLIAIDTKSGKEKWRFSIEPGEGDFYGIQSGATIDRDGYVYFGGRDGYVYCLSPKGSLVWKYKTDDQVDSSPVLGPDGTLYVGSDDKRLYAFGK